MKNYELLINGKLRVRGEHTIVVKVFIYGVKDVGCVLNQEPAHLNDTDSMYMYDSI